MERNMLKRLFLFVIVCFVTIVGVSARSSLGLFVEENVQASPRQHDMTLVSLNTLLGVEPLKNLKVIVDMQSTLGLHNGGDVQTYHYGGLALGGGLAYRLHSYAPGDGILGSKEAIDVRAIVCSSVSKKDFKYSQYSIGLNLYSLDKGKITPTIGLGYRYVKSHTPGYRDQSNVYIEIGLKI